jgi:LysR family transcriptional regulator, nitrogen assimilation regulatory protein
MTRAAALLNITPTSLSLQMKQLEEVLGTQLLRRHSRGVSATERGAAFYEKAEEILRLVQDLEHVFIDGGVVAPRTLRIGVTPAIARMVGVEALTGAAGHIKGVTLLLAEGWTGDMLPRLDTKTLDFVIAYDLKSHGDIEVVHFYDEEFVFICQAGLLPPGSSVELSFAVASGLVFYGQKSVSWRAMLEAASAEGIRFSDVQEVQSIDVWRALICRGLGTSVAPFATIEEEARRGDVSIHRLRGAPVVRRIGMAARKEVLEYGSQVGFVDFISGLIGSAQPDFSVDVGRTVLPMKQTT